MNNIWTILRNGLRNSKGVLIMSFALSVVITAMFVLIINVAEESIANISIGVMDSDRSFVSEDFAEYLKSDVDAKIITSSDIVYMQTELLEKNISAIVEIPKGFEVGILSGSPSPLELTFLDDYANEAFLRAYIDAYTTEAMTLSPVAGGEAEVLKQLMEETAVAIPAVDAVTKDAGQLRRESERSGVDSMLGFYMMFASIIAIGLTSVLFFDRTNGTYRRIKSANATSVQYTVAMSLVGMAMALTAIVLPMLYLGIMKIDAGVPMLILVAMIIIFSIFIVSFGMLIGLTLPSFQSMIFCLIAVGQVMSMLGGAYFPIEYSPEIFQKIALITPQYWFFDAVHSYQDGTNEVRWLLSFGIIALMSLLCFVLTAVRFASSKSAGKPITT